MGIRGEIVREYLFTFVSMLILVYGFFLECDLD